jgi:hypothetical protein
LLSIVELVLELALPSFVLTLLLSKVCRTFKKAIHPSSSHLGPYTCPYVLLQRAASPSSLTLTSSATPLPRPRSEPWKMELPWMPWRSSGRHCRSCRSKPPRPQLRALPTPSPSPCTRTRPSLHPQITHVQHRARSPLPASRVVAAAAVPRLRAASARVVHPSAIATLPRTQHAVFPPSLAAGVVGRQSRRHHRRLPQWPCHHRPPRGKPRPPLGARGPADASPPFPCRRRAFSGRHR